MDFDMIANSAGAIFSGTIPNLNNDKAQFSYGWAGASMEEDHSVPMFLKIPTVSGAKEFMDFIDEIGKDGWNGMGVNLVFADNTGNIGYMMLAALPIRKDQTPYIGCRVLDGSKSTYDWEVGRNAPTTDLPRSFNPEKGYIITANNRQSPDNDKHDYGATVMSTARSIRITEMIEQGI